MACSGVLQGERWTCWLPRTHGHSRAPGAGPGGGRTAWPLQPDARLRARLRHFPAASLQDTRRHGARHKDKQKLARAASACSARVAAGGCQAPAGTGHLRPCRWQDPLSPLPRHFSTLLRFQAGCPPQTSNLKVPCRPCSPHGVLLPGNNGYGSRSCTRARSGRSGHGRAGHPSRAFSERHRAPPRSRARPALSDTPSPGPTAGSSASPGSQQPDPGLPHLLSLQGMCTEDSSLSCRRACPVPRTLLSGVQDRRK